MLFGLIRHICGQLGARALVAGVSMTIAIPAMYGSLLKCHYCLSLSRNIYSTHFPGAKTEKTAKNEQRAILVWPSK